MLLSLPKVLSAAVFLCSWSAQAAQLSGGLLGHLTGNWDVSGTTMGRPTHTHADVTPVFNGAFLAMHVLDPTKQDHYEALVFFGETATRDLVVHWLDVTGGESSRTLGNGHIAGDLVSMTFPYPDGVFHDRLTYDPARDRWRLLVEVGAGAHPRLFSDWFFDRVKGR